MEEFRARLHPLVESVLAEHDFHDLVEGVNAWDEMDARVERDLFFDRNFAFAYMSHRAMLDTLDVAFTPTRGQRLLALTVITLRGLDAVSMQEVLDEVVQVKVDYEELKWVLGLLDKNTHELERDARACYDCFTLDDALHGTADGKLELVRGLVRYRLGGQGGGDAE